MAHVRSVLASVAAAGLAMLAACPAAADLPMVRPPEEPPKRDPIPLRGHEDRAEARRDAIRQAQEAARGDDAGNSPKTPAVDLDVLMKVVSDPKTPIRLRWLDRLTQARDFSRLTIAQQNRAVPELLHLLANRTPLPYCVVLPNEQPLEIRHRANTAMARIAGAYLGRFPGGGPAGNDTPERRAEDTKASADLIARWTAWWREVKELDEAGRRAVASRLRRELLGAEDDDVAGNNLTLIGQAGDLAALTVLAELAGRRHSEETPFARRAVQVFARLCQQKAAPLEARLALLDLLTAINTPAAALQQRPSFNLCARTMQGITGVRPTYERVTVIKDRETNEEVQVMLIVRSTIDAWRGALAKLDEKAKAEKAEQADPPGPAEPGGNVGGR